MKIKAFTTFILLIFLFGSCTENSNNKTSSVSEKTEDTDNVVIGTIAKLSYTFVDPQTQYYGLTLTDGTKLNLDTWTGSDYELKLILNPETKDILLMEKSGSEKLNLKYLDKKVKITFTGKIKTIELLGADDLIASSPYLITGYISALEISNDHSYRQLVFKNDSGEIKKIRLYEDLKGRHHFKFYDGSTKENVVFRLQDNSLRLMPNIESQRVEITVARELLLTKVYPLQGESNHTESFGREFVVTNVEWAEGSSINVETESTSNQTIIATYNMAMVAGGEWSGLVFNDIQNKERTFLEKNTENQIIREFWSEKVTDIETEGSSEEIHTLQSNQGKKYKIIYTTKMVKYQGYDVDGAFSKKENVIVSFEQVP